MVVQGWTYVPAEEGAHPEHPIYIPVEPPPDSGLSPEHPIYFPVYPRVTKNRPQAETTAIARAGQPPRAGGRRAPDLPSGLPGHRAPRRPPAPRPPDLKSGLPER